MTNLSGWRDHARLRRRLRAALAVSACLLSSTALTSCGPEAEEKADTPSGLPVPRWVSVRGSPASMRAGPGLDYPILWRFERSGVPLQVITETREWRKVCGPDGSIAWIHRSLTSGRRRAMALQAVPILSEPEAGSDIRAQLAARGFVSLEGCEGGWCEVSAGDSRGWVPETALFGPQEEAVCRPEATATAGALRVAPGG